MVGDSTGSLAPVRSLEQATAESLDRAWRSSAEIARRAAGNFYYAFIFLPVDKRRGTEALYAFCRVGDDLADDARSGKTARLEGLRRRLDLCYSGKYCDDLTLALADAVRRFGFERGHMDELLLGIESDLTVTRYQTFTELRLYCYRVASTVGLLCLKVFDCDTSAARSYAENLGIGMQLTNILRDLYEDHSRGRIYLPQDELVRFGISDGSLFTPENRPCLVELVRWEVQRAEQFFETAEAALTPELSTPLFAARIMGAVYRRILHRIAELDRFDRRVELPKREKLSIARSIFRESLKEPQVESEDQSGG